MPFICLDRTGTKLVNAPNFGAVLVISFNAGLLLTKKESDRIWRNYMNIIGVSVTWSSF